MKEYIGQRWHTGKPGTTVVVYDSDSRMGESLDPRLDVADFEASRFEWGCSCAGASQLALALLHDAVGKELAAKHNAAFMEEVVAKWPVSCWSVKDEDVRKWVDEKEREELAHGSSEQNGCRACGGSSVE